MLIEDNDLLHNWYETEKANYHISTYGLQEGSDILGENAIFQENGSKCQAAVNHNIYDVSIPVGRKTFCIQ